MPVIAGIEGNEKKQPQMSMGIISKRGKVMNKTNWNNFNRGEESVYTTEATDTKL